MDGLLSILILIGVGIISSHLKAKKAQQKSAQKMHGFDEAVESMAEAKKPISSEILAQFMPELTEGAGAAEAPHTEPVPAQPTVKSAEPVVMSAKPLVKPAAPVKKARPAKAPDPAPLLYMDQVAPEGTVSTQGESAEEHEKHRQKLLAEEERIRMEHEALQEVRNMNLQKLRSAVVMSEILDKPLSLRRRRIF